MRRACSSPPPFRRPKTTRHCAAVSWLVEQVNAGAADLAVLIAPVTVDEFVAVNLARRKMPRKSTWFTPKARAGLVLTEI